VRVIIDFEFSDDERELITKYTRQQTGETGLPKLATRKMLREFVESAVGNQFTAAADNVYGQPA
jgi:hypothetical protein